MDLWSIALEERAKADEERRKSKSIRVFVTSYYGNTVYSPIKGLEQQGRHDGDTNLFFMGSPRCVSILDLLFTRAYNSLHCRAKQQCSYDSLKGKESEA